MTNRADSSRFALVDADGGRRLAVCSWGDPSGGPVIVMHGSPGSRLLRHVRSPGTTYADFGVLAITYDRPGYGLSTAQPGRRVIDAASDVERIADAVGLDRFGVLGISGGAPHALAAAAALPDRVSRCAAVVGSAPLRAPDLTFYDDMPAEIRDFWRRVDAQDVDALRSDWTEFLQWMQAGLPGLSLSRRVMDMLREAFEESARQGDEGYLEDWLAFSIPWGFNIRQVAVPTRLMFARDDTSVPVHHVAWFERHLPDARVDWVDGEHFGPRDEPEMALVAWAADRSPL